jgi:hypothetical protein
MSPRPRRDLTPFVVVLVASAVALFLLVGGLASVGRSSGPYHATVDESFGAEARVLIDQSNSVGAELTRDVADMSTFDRPELSEALDTLVSGADSVASGATAISSPAPEGSVAENFVEAMANRALGVSRLRLAIDGLLAITPSTPAGSTAASSPFPPRAVSVNQAQASVSSVGRLLIGADQSFALARREFRAVPGGSTLPRSVWVNEAVVWQPGAVQTTVDQLSSSPELSPIADVQLVTIELTPPILPPAPAVSGQLAAPALPAGVSQVPPTCSASVTAVVDNEGYVVASKVPVRASVQSVAGGAPFVVEKRVTLAPAADVALTLPQMPVKPGGTYTLTVTIGPPAGQSSPPGSEGATIEVASFGSAKSNARCARAPAAAP